MEKQWEADELEAQQEKVKTGSDINDIKLLEDNNSDLILNTWHQMNNINLTNQKQLQ